MRAIGYFRSVRGEPPLERLEADFEDFCWREVHQPVRTFGDASGEAGGLHPEYQHLVEYIRGSEGSFLVAIPSAGHLGKDLETVARRLIELERVGAKVTCTDEEFPDPLQNAFRRLVIKGVSRTRSDSVTASMRARALKGQGLGKPPYGYRNGEGGTLEVHGKEAVVVELIFRLYAKDGLGLRLIAQHLNERDITTRRGGRWSVVSIRDILRNTAYMGTYTRFGMRLPKSHQAIIPPDLFRRAQDRTQTRRTTGRVVKTEPFLLSGLAHCDYCGNKMMGVTRRQTWKRKDGRRRRGIYRYYQCQSKNNQSLCGYHTWRAPLLEGAVMAQLKQLLSAGPSASTHDASETRRRHLSERLDADVKNAERRFLRAMRRAARAELSIEALGEHLDDLDKTRGEAGAARCPGDVPTTLATWDSLPLAARQGFLREHIARIVVTDDSVEVFV